MGRSSRTHVDPPPAPPWCQQTGYGGQQIACSIKHKSLQAVVLLWQRHHVGCSKRASASDAQPHKPNARMFCHTDSETALLKVLEAAEQVADQG